MKALASNQVLCNMLLAIRIRGVNLIRNRCSDRSVDGISIGDDRSTGELEEATVAIICNSSP